MEHRLTTKLVCAAELSKHAANEGKVVRKMPEVTAYGIEGVAQK